MELYPSLKPLPKPPKPKRSEVRMKGMRRQEEEDRQRFGNLFKRRPRR